MKALLRKLALLVVRGYRINWIVGCSDPPLLPLATGDELRRLNEQLLGQIAHSSTHKVANSVTFSRAGLEGFAIVRNGLPLCVAHLARPDQYDSADIWPIRQHEIAIMDVATEEAARGQGLAPRIMAATTRCYLDAGAERVIGFVWWSNMPAIRADAKAGLYKIGFSIELLIGNKWRSCHIKLPYLRNTRRPPNRKESSAD